MTYGAVHIGLMSPIDPIRGRCTAGGTEPSPSCSLVSHRKRTAKRVFIWPFAHLACTRSEDDGQHGFPTLHLAPGHFKATLTLPFLKRLPLFKCSSKTSLSTRTAVKGSDRL